MRIFQTIHSYPSHIPLFEKRNNINDHSKISFTELQKLLLEDGYASSYILLPALQGKSDEVFFTLGDYTRLQLLWAKEHGLNTVDLAKIKHAQIMWYKPDVFYNMSAYCDDDFSKHYPIDDNILKICWYGIIQETPLKLEDYEIRLTLHKPYIKKWKEMGLKSYEFQGAFDQELERFDSPVKPIDFLFYGQYVAPMFSDRNKLMIDLMKYARNSGLNIKLHLQVADLRKAYINVPLIRRLKHLSPESKFVTANASPPLYGHELYETIGKSKYIINAYTDFNNEYKSNMRVFESLSCGALLVSEEGNYPEGFAADKNYIPYKNSSDLLERLQKLAVDYLSLYKKMLPEIKKVKDLHSKENQWEHFKRIVEENRLLVH